MTVPCGTTSNAKVFLNKEIAQSFLHSKYELKQCIKNIDSSIKISIRLINERSLLSPQVITH